MADMSEPLPPFPYHPDPVATGAVVPSDAVCAHCGRARGHVYAGPVYAGTPGLSGRLCPWCVADGSAAAAYEAHFTSGEVLGDEIPFDVLLAVDTRTPSFTAWQQTVWYAHCGDAAAFLGAAGAAELAAFPDALRLLRAQADAWGWPDDQVEHHLASLHRDGDPTAYLFRCRHCATHLAYADFA
ncbi:CbrC family protein [Streptomyces clavuligerus]|uniref:CbrC family protein n=1 Tax=Streptomyces clavuligerus TaxID=1901 RepID=UPI00020D9231